MLLSIRGIVTVLVLAALFTLAVIWMTTVWWRTVQDENSNE
jgi:hypothetical protein